MQQLDLLFGTPTFLADYRSQVYGKSQISFSEDEFMPYIRSNTYEPLVEAIKKLHAKAGNIKIDPTDDIVIGVGATQMLFAAFKVLYGDSSLKNVHIQSPYWFRFKTITDMAGLGISTERSTKELLVLPNNPDNNLRQPLQDCPAIDACYLWDYYFRDSKDYETAKDILRSVNPVVTLFSLAKCTGNAASRIGWAVVKDKDVARRMRSYIEYSTGGASIEAQVRSASIIEGDVANYDQFTKNVAARLEDRWQMFDNLDLKHIQMLNLRSGGMFGFGECLKPNFYERLSAKGVLYMKGTDCGSHEGTFRINMGASALVLEKFIQVLKEIDGEYET